MVEINQLILVARIVDSFSCLLVSSVGLLVTFALIFERKKKNNYELEDLKFPWHN